MPRRFTPEQHEWLVEHYPTMPNAELAEAFSERFGLPASRSSMGAYGSNHHLRKAEGVRERAMQKYTDEQNDFLREFIPGHAESEIIEAYRERFGVTLRPCQVGNRKVRLGVNSGTQGGQFEKGMTPHNKGKTWDEYMSPEGQAKSRETCFRKGELTGIAAERKQPLLAIRESKDGYLQIKVSPRHQKHTMKAWMSLAQFEWMAANGRDWPEGCMAVFADHDNRNFDPDNIVPVPRELYVIVTGGAHGKALPWHDRASLEVAMTHAQIIRERRRLETEGHTCRTCGRTFKARFPHQANCDECLSTRRKRKRKKTDRTGASA